MEFTQIREKMARRLSLMFGSGFKPSRDPQKGYGSTFADFMALSRDTDQVGADGASVVIDPLGEPVAKQMWDSVRDVTTYAKTLG